MHQHFRYGSLTAGCTKRFELSALSVVQDRAEMPTPVLNQADYGHALQRAKPTAALLVSRQQLTLTLAGQIMFQAGRACKGQDLPHSS